MIHWLMVHDPCRAGGLWLHLSRPVLVLAAATQHLLGQLEQPVQDLLLAADEPLRPRDAIYHVGLKLGERLRDDAVNLGFNHDP
ncbi:hypothetical protein EDB81DRAFT_771370 [Dactylonectria macrodidyma]|uniref:Uncharacterized protein n=1 Tax=Dactylonectria macrodidyma TaxID=307937 RepID=A0A9P9FTV0_9HYPO|nr:hypothetical protein EDB81DRAFT_771370 [Dactylonectria macrodidyma]